MRDTFQRQREELRSRIARSRHRFERQATLLVHHPLRLTGYSLADDHRTSFWSTFSAGIALLLAHRYTGHPKSGSWQNQFLGSAFSAALNQVLRRLRVLAWQAKRRRRQNAQGSEDE